jgi:uncharacterized protein (TIRG00374 family)
VSGPVLRRVGTAVLTGACLAYVVWKIDIPRTARLLENAQLAYFFGAMAIMLAAVAPMAWRWQQLLRARGVEEGLPWLTRMYFVSYAVAQVLPTSLGGDAARMFSTVRRHRGCGTAVSGSVLLERALGGAATLILAGIGFVLAIGHYDVGPYLWLEAAIGVVTVMLGVLLFSRRARRLLGRLSPILHRAHIERPLRMSYEGIHSYRDHVWLLAGTFILTIGVQAIRVAAIWLIGKSVGVNLSPRPYYVMGPMLFLVMIVPFTVNGIALREAFFVSFLGKLGIDPDLAFATGFLFFLSSVFLALPGAAILGLEAALPGTAPLSRSSGASSEADSG